MTDPRTTPDPAFVERFPRSVRAPYDDRPDPTVGRPLGNRRYVVTAVHVPSRTVTLHLIGPAVLEPADLHRFRRQLDDALAAVIADGGDYG